MPPTTTDFAAFATRIAESDASWAWANGLGEGWVTAMVLEAVVSSSNETLDAGHVLSSLNKLDVDPRGLRGSRVTFTPDNHFRTQGSYKVYRWDSQTEQITVVSDWDAVDIVPRPD